MDPQTARIYLAHLIHAGCLSCLPRLRLPKSLDFEHQEKDFRLSAAELEEDGSKDLLHLDLTQGLCLCAVVLERAVMARRRMRLLRLVLLVCTYSPQRVLVSRHLHMGLSSPSPCCVEGADWHYQQIGF
jgi:hypothetical protein